MVKTLIDLKNIGIRFWQYKVKIVSLSALRPDHNLTIAHKNLTWLMLTQNKGRIKKEKSVEISTRALFALTHRVRYKGN